MFHRLYYCPVCNRGFELNRDTAKQYQIIAEVNTSFLNKSITDEERITRIENANAAINLIEQKKQVKYLKESEDYQAVVGSKSDDELYGILNNQSDQYSQAFLIAVEQEMKNRNLSPNI